MLAPTIETIPEHFYKYRSLRGDQKDFARLIFAKNELYWDSPLNFNDPFDCAPVHTMKGSALKRELTYKRIFREWMPQLSQKERAQKVKEALKNPAKNVEAIMTEGQRALLKQTAVCCLSTVPDNVLMWSHYADAHAGLCLRFTPAAKRGAPDVATADGVDGSRSRHRGAKM